MKKLLCLMGGAMFCIQAISQNGKALAIGDRVPKITLHHVLNYKSDSLNLFDFKGKVIIFDFWATWCGACIEALPHMQDLQEKFGDQIQVIAVTDQSKKRISSFFGLKAHKNLKALTFPFITADSILHALLGVTGAYPFEIWVDKNGMVVGRTAAKDVTEDNIRTLINNELPEFDNRSLGPIPKFSIKDHPLISILKGGKVFYSAFAGFLEKSVRKGMHKYFDSINHTVRYDLLNSSPIILASWALNFPHPITAKECDLLVKDTACFFYTKDLGDRKDWEKKNTFSFETIVPQINSLALAKANLLQKLERHLAIRASIVEKRVSCLVIKDKDKPDINRLKGSRYYASTLKEDTSGNFHYTSIASSLSSLARLINRTKLFSAWPLVINESKGRKTLQLNIGQHPEDISIWQKELEHFDLQLVTEKRVITMLQIKEGNRTSYQLN